MDVKTVYRTLVLLLVIFVPPVLAGEADIIAVKVKQTSDGIYRFDVAVSHSDTGWQHYANKWDIVLPTGEILATRTLHHPHVDEQPFTRSLSGIKISKDINHVIIRAHDSVHNYGGLTLKVYLQY